MRSFEVRGSLRWLDAVTLIAAICVLNPAGAQPFRGDPDPIGDLADQILETQAGGGPFAPELIAPLTQLGLLYEERGDYAREAAVLEQALQVTRANYGLRSLEQLPLLRQRIRNEESIGNFTDAWNLEQSLLSLAKKHPDDVRTAPIFHEVADKRMELLESFLSGNRPPQVYLGCYFDQGSWIPGAYTTRKCSSGMLNVAARAILRDAQVNYLQAVGVLYKQQQFDNSELHELEDKLLQSSYDNRIYGTGRRSLERLIEYDAANSEPEVRRFDRLVQLADWDLAYGYHTLALDFYAQLYAYLEKKDANRTRAEAYFSPEVPAVVPTFLPNLLSPERAAGAIGHVDVEFEVTRFGTPRRIDIVDATSNVSRAGKRDIARWIIVNRFRPNIVDGEIPRATRVTARYYVHE